MYAIIETDIYGNIPENEDDRCYLNHSCLSSFSFGSLDMAWTTDNELAAEGMSARIEESRHFRHHKIIEI